MSGGVQPQELKAIPPKQASKDMRHQHPQPTDQQTPVSQVSGGDY